MDKLGNEAKNTNYFNKILQARDADISLYRLNQKMLRQCDDSKKRLLDEQDMLRKRIFQPLDGDSDDTVNHSARKIQKLQKWCINTPNQIF